jgi:hypothetical protein
LQYARHDRADVSVVAGNKYLHVQARVFDGTPRHSMGARSRL